MFLESGTKLLKNVQLGIDTIVNLIQNSIQILDFILCFFPNFEK